MTDKTQLIALAERCEKAEGPDKLLDAEIYIALYYHDWKIQTNCDLFPDEVREGRIQEPAGCGWRRSPNYTASLDTAMTLVPEGWTGFIPVTSGDEAWIWESAPRPGKGHRGNAATPALALAAACLRALAGEG